MFPIEICYIFKNTFFYRISPVAASAFIRSTHAFWIKLLETPVQVFSCEFYEIIKKTLSPPPAAASFCHKVQNIKIQDDS